jgi:hypothetical protein
LFIECLSANVRRRESFPFGFGAGDGDGGTLNNLLNYY